MNRRFKRYLFLAAALFSAACASSASAQIDLRFSPPDTTFEPNATMRLSVMLDEAIFFRTVELTVTYDSTLIRSVSGDKGTLFSDSEILTWVIFEEDVPGLWHGAAILMSATDSLSGPGELFAWEIEGLVQGTTPITAVDVRLFEPNATPIPEVTLEATTVRVRWEPSAVGDLPAIQPDLKIFPNPFNPATRIGFDNVAGDHVLLAVFDARGRRVATLHEGRANSGPIYFDWDGRDDQGIVQPGGVYLFRLDSSRNGITHTATTKGILLK